MGAPSNRTATLESQMIPMIQDVFGQTLKRPPLKSLNACTRKVASRVMSADLSHREANRMFDSVEGAPLMTN